MLKYLKYRKNYFIILKSKIELRLKKHYYKKQFIEHAIEFTDKKGIEIGGPSKLFHSDVMPIYQLAATIDGCNYSNRTIWEGVITSNEYRYYEKKIGNQFILEGTDLSKIDSESYDFLLSCHNLEHIANPIKALKEWHRILKKNGTIVLVLPDKRFTFDRKRADTSFTHLLKDYDDDIDENDLTHLEDILSYHDLQMDQGAGDDFELFKKRGENNIENRCLHHHVFGQNLLKQLFDYLDIKTASQYFIPPFHQVIIGKR